MVEYKSLRNGIFLHMDYSFNIYWSTIAYLPSMYSRLKNGIEASVANGRRKQLVLKHFKYNTTTYFYTLFEVSKTLNCFSIDQKRTPSILNNLVTSKKTFCLLFQCTFAQQMWSKMEFFFVQYNNNNNSFSWILQKWYLVILKYLRRYGYQFEKWKALLYHIC